MPIMILIRAFLATILYLIVTSFYVAPIDCEWSNMVCAPAGFGKDGHTYQILIGKEADYSTPYSEYYQIIGNPPETSLIIMANNRKTVLSVGLFIKY